MLPFHKRSGRSDEVAEDLNSEDIDVIAVQRKGLRVPTPLPPAASPSVRPLPAPMPPPSRPSGRPMAMESIPDEVTMLMPSKALTLPPAPRSVRPGMYEGEDSTRTVVRSSPSHAPSYAPPAPSSGRALGSLPPSSSPRGLDYASPSFPPPPGLPGGFHAIPAAPPSVSPVTYGVQGRHGSDPRMDPPGTVITTRTKLLTGRPTLSWGAALVALGVFAGLVTAVLARGDGDSLVDATASFIDPAHAAKAAPAPVLDMKQPASAAASQPIAMQPQVQQMAQQPAMPQTAPQMTMPQSAPAAAPTTAMQPMQPMASSPMAASEPSAPAPMAYAHPADKPATAAAAPAVEKKDPPKPAAIAMAPAPVHAAAPAAAPRPTPTPVAKAAAPAADKPASAPSKKGPKDDLASAKEAKALADAQLEASLR